MSEQYGSRDIPDGAFPGKPRWSVGLIVGVIVALVAGGALAWWLFGRGGGDAPGVSPTPSATAIAEPTPEPTPSPPSSAIPSASPTPSASAPGATCEEFGTDESSNSSSEWSSELRNTIWGVDMRVGTHDCYDRWVFEFAGEGEMPGWSVTVHDSNTFAADASGEDIEPLAGEAALEVAFGAWYDGTPIDQDAYAGQMEILTDGFPAIQEARIVSGYEGMSQVGIGLDEVRPYRVTWLSDPNRLVIDVYHG